jgi:hypothetical protein
LAINAFSVDNGVEHRKVGCFLSVVFVAEMLESTGIGKLVHKLIVFLKLVKISFLIKVPTKNTLRFFSSAFISVLGSYAFFDGL